MAMVNGSSNPSETLSQIAVQNENVRSVMDYVQQHNGNAKEAFFALAKEKGVDPNSIINALK